MTTIKVTEIERTYTNFGMHVEQCLAYMLTGEVRKHDRVPFYVDSDIPEFGISVKSSGFTLASANVNFGETKEEKIADYMARVVSKTVAYVTQDMVAYMMNLEEFREFIEKFCYLGRESQAHGGGLKLKCYKESKKMLSWLNAKVEAVGI